MEKERSLLLSYMISLLDNSLFRKSYYSILIVFSFGIILNLCPFNLTTKDAGEYLVAARNLTIAHPPGAILYIILLKLFLVFGIKGAYILNIIFAIIFSIFSFLIFRTIISAKEVLKDKYANLLSATLLFFLVNNTFFQRVFLFIETDAIICTLLSICIYFFIKRNFLLSLFVFSSSFLVNYQLLFFAPVFVFYPIYKKKINIRIFLLIFVLLFSGFIYLYARTDALYSWDPGIKSIVSLFDYLTLKEYSVRNVLINKNFATLDDFIKYYPNSTLFYLFFLFLTPLIAFFRKESRFVFILVVLYSIFFIYVSRASAMNSIHYAFPLVFFSYLSICFLYIVLDEKWIILAILFLIPDISFLNTSIYRYGLPEKYFEISTRNIKNGIYLIARDCHINYFRWLIDKNSDIIPVNIEDLRRKQNREELSLRLGIMLPDASIPSQINYLISTKIYKVYFENDPLFDFINAPSAIQGIRREAFGEFENIITKGDIESLPKGHEIEDEEIRNIIVGIKNGYMDQQHLQPYTTGLKPASTIGQKWILPLH